MEIKTEALVIKTLKYGDSSLIIDMLTREQGRQSFLIRIPKTQKGKLKRQLFQPLSLLSLVYDYRQRSQLQHLRDARISRPYCSLQADAVKTCLAMFLAELLLYTTRGEQRDVPLFTFVAQSLMWLDGAESGFANFHLIFMLRLTRFLGFYPNEEDYSDGDFFDLRGGVFTAQAPLHHDFLQPSEASLLVKLMRLDYASMHLLQLNHNDRNRIAEMMIVYYRLHVADMPELRSFDVMKELFS